MLSQLKDTLVNSIQSGKLTLTADLLGIPVFEDVLRLLNLDPLEIPLGITASDIFIQDRPVNEEGIPVPVGSPDATSTEVPTLLLSDAGANLLGTSSDNFTVYIWEHNGSLELVARGTLSGLALLDLVTLGLVDLNGIELPVINFVDFTLEGLTLGKKVNLIGDTSQETIELIPGLGVSIVGPGFIFQNEMENNLPSPVKLDLKGTILVGEAEIEPAISIPLDADIPWNLNLQDTVDNIKLQDVFQLLAGVNIFQELPSELEIGDQFSLANLNVEFDYSESLPQLKRIQLGLNLPDWTIIDGVLTINGPTLFFDIAEPLASTRTIETTIVGGFTIGSGTDAETLTVTVQVPSGSRDWLVTAAPESFALNSLNTFVDYLGSVSLSNINLPGDLSSSALQLNLFELEFNPAKKSVSRVAVSLALDAEWSVVSNELALADPFITIVAIYPLDATRRVVSFEAGGKLSIGDTDFMVFGNRDGVEEVWSFTGSLATGDTMPVGELIFQFLGLSQNELPGFVQSFYDFTIETLLFSITSGTETAYTFVATTGALWEFELNPGDPNTGLGVDALSLEITHQNDQTQAEICGFFDVFNFEFSLCYGFDKNAGTNTQTIELEWEGIVGSYTIANNSDATLTLTVEDRSLGEILESLVNTIKGRGRFRLPAPWDILNKISLDGLTFSYVLSGAQEGTIALIFDAAAGFPAIDLIFLKINGISLSRQGSNNELQVELAGEFLFGEPIPAWDATDEDPPEIPGQGTALLDLRLLALGQRVEILNASSFANMQEAILAMRAFSEPSTDTPLANGDVTGIAYNDASNWLVGMDFGMLKLPAGAGYTLQLAVLFNDPNLYGLRLALDGDKVAIFKGLEFEILYKKISDSVGLYHIELILPDIMRYLEFGAASIVLPEIVVDIYTNGDFKVDLGFPYDLDFSRSFSMTVIVLGIPFMGSGGIYFGKLSSATTDLAPDTELGTFNPIFIFGLGLEVGIGKAVSYGPLKARFSLTILGILEGVIATFNPYDNAVANDTQLEKTKYYWVQGTLGLQGILEGEVDFKIVKGSVYVRVYIIAQITLEAYRQTRLLAEAGVEVKVKVKVGAGFLSVTLSFSFSATISVEFLIGENSVAPWESSTSSSMLFASARVPAQLIGTQSLVFVPNNIDPADRKTVNLYLSLQPSVQEAASGTMAATYAALLAIDSPARDAENTGNTGFEILAQEVFYWLANSILSDVGMDQASLNEALLTRMQIEDALTFLRTETETGSPVNEADIEAFLNSHLQVNISVPDATINYTEASVFPMPSQTSLQFPASSIDRDLNAYSAANGAYIDFLEGYFDLLLTQIQSESSVNNQAVASSLTTQVFEGYFELIIKHLLEESLQSLQNYAYTLQAGDSLHSILAAVQAEGATTLSVSSIAEDNRFHPIQFSVIEGSLSSLGDPTLAENLDELNLHTLANTYEKTLTEVAILWADTADLFDQSSNNQLIISGLDQLKISTYLSSFQRRRSQANLSSMLARFLLGGTRLPKNEDLNLAESGFENLKDYGFYALTGQQFPLPVLESGTTYLFHLVKNAGSSQSWLTLNEGASLSHELSAEEISQINALLAASETWSLDQTAIEPVPSIQRFPRNYNFSSYIEWEHEQNEADVISLQNALLWPVNEALGHYLSKYPVDEQFDILAGTFNQASRKVEFENTSLEATWASLITLEIKRELSNDASPYHYELIGSDEQGIALLEALFTSQLEGKIQAVEVLFEHDPAIQQGGYKNRTLGRLTSFIVQSNLSTETNPTEQTNFMRFAPLPDPELRGILPGNLVFLKKIWTASITRTGGYYLYFHDFGIDADAEAAGLPDYLFDANQSGKIQILVTYQADMAPGPYWNTLLTNRAIDLERSQLYARSAVQEDIRNIMPVGTLGFKNERPVPADPDTGSNYLDNIFQLLTYKMDESSGVFTNQFTTDSGVYPLNPSPVGPTEPPTGEPASDNFWKYEMYLPIYRFVKQPSDYLLSTFNSNWEAPLNTENPYAGLGSLPNIYFYWRDLYGNQPFAPGGGNLYTPPTDLKYQDPIIPISNWPQLQYFYQLGATDPAPSDPNLANELAIVLSFNESRYEIERNGQPLTTEELIEAYDNDRRLYQNIYYQLFQKSPNTNTAHINFCLPSSFLNDDLEAEQAGLLPDSEADKLRTFVAEIYHFLATKAADPAVDIAPPAAITLSRNFADSDITTAAISELNVYFGLERPADTIETQATGTSVQRVRTVLKPFLEIDAEEATTIPDSSTLSRRHSLQGFAEQFEADYATIGGSGLKLATGIDKQDLNTNIKSKDLWVVRMVEVDVTIDQTQARYYGLSPLSTSLISREVPIYVYDNSTGTGLTTTDAPILAFADIDMDDWARLFLEAVDEFLRPELAIPAFLLDRQHSTNHLGDIRTSKQTIATQIAKTQLERIFEETPSDPALQNAAVDKLEQQLLIQLSKAYEINTVVQFPVTGQAGSEQLKARFYGKPKVNMDLNNDGLVSAAEQDLFRNYSFSNAKIPLQESSDLTFLFSTKRSKTQPAVQLNMQYQITHLEIDVEEVIVEEDQTTYEGSTWLTFVLPISASGTNILEKPLDELNIPVILRDYPTDVNLLSQKAVQSFPPSVDSSALEALQNATAWDYEVSYLQNMAAQDMLHATLQLNLIPVGQAMFSSGGTRTLFDELATFVTRYPAVKADLNTLLTGIDAGNVGDDHTPALRSLSAFAALVQNVANCWGTWVNEDSTANDPAPTELPSESYTCSIREQLVIDGTDTVFEIQVKERDTFNQGVKMPVIQWGGEQLHPEEQLGPDLDPNIYYGRYVKPNGDYLSWEEAKSDPNRTFFVDLLNILAYQNVNLEVQLQRNIALVDGFTTRESFVYTTPKSKFPNKLVPFLDNRIEINIGEIDGDSSADTITNHLVSFLQTLLDKDNQDQTPELKISVDYGYQLPGQEDLPYVRTPIVMAPPFEFQINSGNFVASSYGFIPNLAAEMEQWLQVQKPAPNAMNRRFFIDLAIFSHLQQSRLPILRLRNVILQIEDIG